MSEQTFYVGVKGIIIVDDKVLLLHGSGGKGRRDIWEAPGGRIDGEESMQQTLERELNEEVSNIKNVKIGGILHATRLTWVIDGTNSLALVFFRVQAEFDGDPVISDEHSEWKWCTLEEARGLANEITLPAIEAAFVQ